MKQNPPSHEAIAERAYLLWEQAGRPEGRDQEFWLNAANELHNPPAPVKAARKTPRVRRPTSAA